MVDCAKPVTQWSGQYKPELLHNQFLALIAGAALGLALGAPAFLIAFPGSRTFTPAYLALVVLFCVLAVFSGFSDRPRQIANRALRPMWEHAWLKYLAAALWLAIAFFFLWQYRFAYGEARLSAYLALCGAALCSTAGLAICMGPDLVDTWGFLNSRRARFLSLLLVGGWIAFGFYLWGENLNAWWWIIDDHEIIKLIGNGLSPFEIWPRLSASTVMGQVTPFSTARFRPMFWIFQYLEGAIWGDQPFLWYFFRTSIFILAGLVCYRLLVPVLGKLNSALVTLVLAAFPFWGDIFARLGPAENYALLGLVGYALTFSALLRYYRSDSPNSDRWLNVKWVVLGASAVLVIGVKENFVWLLLPNVLLLVYLIVKRRRAMFGMLVLVLSSALGPLSLASVFLTNTTQGADAYGNSAVVTNRIANVLGALQRNFIGLPALAAFGGFVIILCVGAIVLYRAGDREGLVRLGHSVLIGVCLAGCLVAVYVSQLYFYNGALPSDSRYDFPASLIPAFLGLIGIVLILLTIHLTLKQPYYDALAALVLTLALAGIIVVNGYSAARDAGHANFERTRQFRDALAQIESVARAHPQAALVLDTHSGWDYEASYSVVRFLRRAGVENPTFLRYTDLHQDPDNPLQKVLAQQLADIVQGAGPSEYYEPFQRFTGDQCFGIGFSGDSTPPCEPLTRIWR